MALLNPPETRLSVIVLIARHLAGCANFQDDKDRLINCLSPIGLADENTASAIRNSQNDASINLTQAIEIGIVEDDKDITRLSTAAASAIHDGTDAFVKHARTQILDTSRNRAAWRSQKGARDLTNALAWHLSIPATRAPEGMEAGPEPRADTLLEEDFGPREEDEGEGFNWPVVGRTRWPTFGRWACSLGFAWRDPSGRLIPDPTVAIRDVLSDVFAEKNILPAKDFIGNLGVALPVLEGGAYRKFVEKNWNRPADDRNRLSQATTDALRRLQWSGTLDFRSVADDPEVVTYANGEDFSEVTLAQSGTN